MALPDLPGGLPGNLSRSAVDDLIRLLRRSAREFGVVVSRRSRARLLRQIEAIRDGKAIGYRRPDVQPRRPTRFLNEVHGCSASTPTRGKCIGSYTGHGTFQPCLAGRSLKWHTGR